MLERFILIPVALCGFGWLWLVSIGICIRNKLIGNPHGGNEGGLIEAIMICFFAGILTLVGIVVAFVTLPFAWVAFGLLGYIILALVNYIVLWK